MSLSLPTGLEAAKVVMLIILDVPDLASAEAFIQVEPYNHNGVFERVTIRQWRQVLPESQPGELLHQIQQH